MVAAVLLLPAGPTSLIHFQTLSSNFLTREMLAGLRGAQRASNMEKALLLLHKSDRPLCFIYFCGCATLLFPVAQQSAAGKLMG